MRRLGALSTPTSPVRLFERLDSLGQEARRKRETTMAKAKHEPMLASYVDILGFGELIKMKTAGEISRILPIFNETTATPTLKNRERICR
jgi:hypothetical protein